MKAATSPVNAPSFCSAAQFCAATLMFEPSRRSATLFKAVKTGAITISQRFALATSGFSATAVATESATVLNIFQFPAMTGFRMIGKDTRVSARSSRTPVVLASLVTQRLLLCVLRIRILITACRARLKSRVISKHLRAARGAVNLFDLDKTCLGLVE